MSRTDERGVIQSGNQTFKILSGYEWTELIGAPHKIIRHPDMPRAAFYALWSTLEAGLPFGAYVKNRAKCGRYYWVFAAAVPISGGYLSVRIKPTSPLLETVEGLYKTLLLAEKEEGQTPEEGLKVIEDTVRSLGFRSYSAFMGYALENAAHTEFTGLEFHCQSNTTCAFRTGEEFLDLAGGAGELVRVDRAGSERTTGRVAVSDRRQRDDREVRR